MALFYVGHRPVVKERFLGEQVHPWKGTEEKYSNYSLFNTANVLDGAPNTIREPSVYDKSSDLENPGHANTRRFEYNGLDDPLGGPFRHKFDEKDPHLNKQDNPLRGEFDGLDDKDRLNPYDPGKNEVGVANALKSNDLGHEHVVKPVWNGVESDRAIF